MMKAGGRKFKIKCGQAYTLSLRYIYGSLLHKLSGREGGVKVRSEDNGRFVNRSMRPPSVRPRVASAYLDEVVKSNLHLFAQASSNSRTLNLHLGAMSRKFLP